MIVEGLNFPSIGFIRAKPVGKTGRYLLTIHPPGPGPLPGFEPATMVEVDVPRAVVERIARLAPHLLADRRRHSLWAAGGCQDP